MQGSFEPMRKQVESWATEKLGEILEARFSQSF
jgi:hypothetical protein